LTPESGEGDKGVKERCTLRTNTKTMTYRTPSTLNIL